MIRVGLIGCGFIAKKHLKTLTRFDEVTLVAVSDLSHKNKREAVDLYQIEGKRQLSVSFFKNFQDVLKNKEFDVVIISVISGFHAEIAEHFLEYVKVDIVEILIALSLADFKDN